MAARILVVDDDPEIRQGLQTLLGFMPGVEVVAVPGVAQGRVAGRQTAWDIVISDEQMPDGRGSELLSELRAASPGAHHVLMSGFADFDGILRGPHGPGIDHFFRKPYDAMDVVAWVQRTLRERAQRGPAPVVREGPFRRLGAAKPATDAPVARAAPPPVPPPAPPPAAPALPAPLAAPPPALPPLPTPAPAAAPPAPPVAVAPPKPRPPPPPAALEVAVGEGLADVETLLRWARAARSPDEQLKHLRMAQRRLEQTARTLVGLGAREA